jgi:hypothetical protein
VSSKGKEFKCHLGVAAEVQREREGLVVEWREESYQLIKMAEIMGCMCFDW